MGDRIMRERIREAVTKTINGLYKCGVIDRVTRRNIEKLCLPEVKRYSPEEIVAIRKKYNLSQAALASLFNVSVSTVQKWEQGKKKPMGVSCKLLDIVERKGIEVLL